MRENQSRHWKGENIADLLHAVQIYKIYRCNIEIWMFTGITPVENSMKILKNCYMRESQ
jgi:hypothetical protein